MADIWTSAGESSLGLCSPVLCMHGNRFVLRWRLGGVACEQREREQKLCINNWAKVLEGVASGAL